MVEFCENCGSMMLPSKETEENALICNLCGKKRQLNDEIIESYTITKTIEHIP